MGTIFFNNNNFYNYYVYVQLNASSTPNSYDYINQEWSAKNTSLSFGVAPIGGSKYFLIPRLCFSAEATINLSYFKQDKMNQYS